MEWRYAWLSKLSEHYGEPFTESGEQTTPGMVPGALDLIDLVLNNAGMVRAE